MAQFELFELPSRQLVCDLQTDLLAVADTRLAAPLVAVTDLRSVSQITPVVQIDGEVWVVMIPQMGAIPKAALHRPVGSLAHHRDAIKRAIDILIDGV